MKKLFFVLFFLVVAFSINAQKIRLDTTVKIGTIGYRVTCGNKSVEKNNLSITLIGFDEHPNDINVEVKGKATKVEIDDFNRDGLPDLIIYIFTGEQKKGNVFAIVCQEKKTVTPILFPDIMDDEKLKVGYNGNDEFKLLNGVLMRRFPVINNTDTNTTKTNFIRQILYKVLPAENGTYKFKVDRSVDVAKP